MALPTPCGGAEVNTSGANALMVAPALSLRRQRPIIDAIEVVKL